MGKDIASRPFIKKFRTSKHYYIYDVNTNEIIQVNRVVFDIIYDSLRHGVDWVVNKFKAKYPEDEITLFFKEIHRIKEEFHFFSSHKPRVFPDFLHVEDSQARLESNLMQLILEVTVSCNLDCKYCNTSGNYAKRKTDEPLNMTLDTALKAVDFFISRSKRRQGGYKPAITFYGGEPLLRFELIREIVEYTKRIGKFEAYGFSLTSNAALLDDEIIDYLVSNHISILVSLDGNRELHDRYRVTINDEGTFDKVMENLEKIKRRSKKYFINNISFNAIVTPPYDFESIIEFFFRNRFFKPFRDKVHVNIVEAHDTSFLKDFGLTGSRSHYTRQMTWFRKRFKNALINQGFEELAIEKRFFLEDFYCIAFRQKYPLGEKYAYQGGCIPGQRRLFVNTSGNFFMCEKVGSNFSIGNVDNGFDYRAISEFYEKYDQFFKECRYCWALRLCKKCFNDIRIGANFDPKRKEDFCQSFIGNLEKNLITYCEIIEENPDAFRALEKVILC